MCDKCFPGFDPVGIQDKQVHIKRGSQSTETGQLKRPSAVSNQRSCIAEFVDPKAKFDWNRRPHLTTPRVRTDCRFLLCLSNIHNPVGGFYCWDVFPRRATLEHSATFAQRTKFCSLDYGSMWDKSKLMYICVWHELVQRKVNLEHSRISVQSGLCTIISFQRAF